MFLTIQVVQTLIIQYLFVLLTRTRAMLPCCFLVCNLPVNKTVQFNITSSKNIFSFDVFDQLGTWFRVSPAQLDYFFVEIKHLVSRVPIIYQ